MATKANTLPDGEAEPAPEIGKTVPELKAIKRLLALLLLQNGAPQKAVAKAAGVRLLTINQMAKGIGKPKKQQPISINEN